MTPINTSAADAVAAACVSPCCSNVPARPHAAVAVSPVPGAPVPVAVPVGAGMRRADQRQCRSSSSRRRGHGAAPRRVGTLASFDRAAASRTARSGAPRWTAPRP